MSWMPRFPPVSEETLIDNLEILIRRDYKPALLYLYPTGRLKDFAEIALGQVLGNEAPFLALAPIRNASTMSEDSARLAKAFRVDLVVGVTDDGPATVTRRIERHMETLEQVLRAGNKDDFFGSVNSEYTFGFSIDCEHVYRQDIRSNGSILFRDATLQLTVNVNVGQLRS